MIIACFYAQFYGLYSQINNTKRRTSDKIILSKFDFTSLKVDKFLLRYYLL
jgi:hypothetical protein